MMLIHNAALADEIFALNAIYGDGTVTATFSNSDHTTISLRLFDLSYSFLLHIANTYPRSTPRVLGIDDLMQSTRVEARQNVMYFQACIVAAKHPDGVCFFDAIEQFDPIFTMQRAHYLNIEHGLDPEKEENEERLAMLRQLVDKAALGSPPPPSSATESNPSSDIVGCAVCMEPFFRIDTATLKCQHSYCHDCLADGIKFGFTERSELKCCGKSIPNHIVRDFAGFDEAWLKFYFAYLRERHSPNPIYCPYFKCNAFIPQVCMEGEKAKCPVCKKQLCVACKDKEHRVLPIVQPYGGKDGGLQSYGLYLWDPILLSLWQDKLPVWHF
ncbi:hypothetical protein LTR84_009643 [Exophiala bonariae]|uniref:RING-type domain-containing protein n=1 Tax=Exophiala bonariae TaxID=1690606 RepID=A0AAV9NMI1_9EURO|nr:hypothetical protein LTR84_009643 [Exophiala bonariae]